MPLESSLLPTNPLTCSPWPEIGPPRSVGLASLRIEVTNKSGCRLQGRTRADNFG